MISEKARTTAARYKGSKALDYDRSRAGTAKWSAEDGAVRALLADLPRGSILLDVPVGTGRFIPLYEERAFTAIGLDVSEQMLAQARPRAKTSEIRNGNIFKLDMTDGLADVALSIRFMNLVEESDMQIALRELQRVTRRWVAFTLRIGSNQPTGHYHSPHSLAAVEESLRPGWVMEDAALHQHDYRMVRLLAP